MRAGLKFLPVCLTYFVLTICSSLTLALASTKQNTNNTNKRMVSKDGLYSLLDRQLRPEMDDVYHVVIKEFGDIQTFINQMYGISNFDKYEMRQEQVDQVLEEFALLEVLFGNFQLYTLGRDAVAYSDFYNALQISLNTKKRAIRVDLSGEVARVAPEQLLSGYLRSLGFPRTKEELLSGPIIVFADYTGYTEGSQLKRLIEIYLKSLNLEPNELKSAHQKIIPLTSGAPERLKVLKRNAGVTRPALSALRNLDRAEAWNGKFDSLKEVSGQYFVEAGQIEAPSEDDKKTSLLEMLSYLVAAFREPTRQTYHEHLLRIKKSEEIITGSYEFVLSRPTLSEFANRFNIIFDDDSNLQDAVSGLFTGLVAVYDTHPAIANKYIQYILNTVANNMKNNNVMEATIGSLEFTNPLLQRSIAPLRKISVYASKSKNQERYINQVFDALKDLPSSNIYLKKVFFAQLVENGVPDEMLFNRLIVEAQNGSFDLAEVGLNFILERIRWLPANVETENKIRFLTDFYIDNILKNKCDNRCVIVGTHILSPLFKHRKDEIIKKITDEYLKTYIDRDKALMSLESQTDKTYDKRPENVRAAVSRMWQPTINTTINTMRSMLSQFNSPVHKNVAQQIAKKLLKHAKALADVIPYFSSNTGFSGLEVEVAELALKSQNSELIRSVLAIFIHNIDETKHEELIKNILNFAMSKYEDSCVFVARYLADVQSKSLKQYRDAWVEALTEKRLYEATAIFVNHNNEEVYKYIPIFLNKLNGNDSLAKMILSKFAYGPLSTLYGSRHLHPYVPLLLNLFDRYDLLEATANYNKEFLKLLSMRPETWVEIAELNWPLFQKLENMFAADFRNYNYTKFQMERLNTSAQMVQRDGIWYLKKHFLSSFESSRCEKQINL